MRKRKYNLIQKTTCPQCNKLRIFRLGTVLGILCYICTKCHYWHDAQDFIEKMEEH